MDFMKTLLIQIEDRLNDHKLVKEANIDGDGATELFIKLAIEEDSLERIKDILEVCQDDLAAV